MVPLIWVDDDRSFAFYRRPIYSHTPPAPIGLKGKSLLLPQVSQEKRLFRLANGILRYQYGLEMLFPDPCAPFYALGNVESPLPTSCHA